MSSPCPNPADAANAYVTLGFIVGVCAVLVAGRINEIHDEEEERKL